MALQVTPLATSPTTLVRTAWTYTTLVHPIFRVSGATNVFVLGRRSGHTKRPPGASTSTPWDWMSKRSGNCGHPGARGWIVSVIHPARVTRDKTISCLTRRTRTNPALLLAKDLVQHQISLASFRDGARLDVQVHDLEACLGRIGRPRRQSGAIRIAGLDEIGEILFHYF